MTTLAPTSHPTPEQIDKLVEQAWVSQGDLAKTWQLLAHLKEQCETIDYPFGWACYHCTLASYYYLKSNYPEALQMAMLAAEQFNDAPTSMWKYRFHFRLVSIYMYLGLFAESLHHGFLAQKLAEELQLERERIQCLIGIGATYVSAEDHPAALQQLTHALTVLEALNIKYPDLYALCLINLAQTYLAQQQHDKAAECAEKIIKIAPQITSSYDQARMKYAALLALSEVATHQNKPFQAIKYAENILNTVKNDSRFTQITLHARQILGQGYLNLKQFAEAEKHLLRGIEVAQEIQLIWFEYQFYEQLAQLYAQQNEFKKAFEAYQKFHTLKEKAFNDQNQKKVQSLEILHQIDLAKKEAALYAELYQEEQNRRKLAETLREVGILIASSLELEQVLDKILVYLTGLVPYDRALILHAEKDSTLSVLAISGQAHEQAHPPQIRLDPADTKILWRIYESKQPYKIDHLADEPEWTTNPLVKDPVSWVGVPLLAYGEFKGVLALFRYNYRPFTPDEIQTASIFGASAVVALENAHLFAQVKQFNEQLEDKVKEQTQSLRLAYAELERVNLTLEQRVLERTQALNNEINEREKLIDELNAFSHTVAHDLKSPLTGIVGYGELLLEEIEQLSPQEIEPLVNNMVRGARRMQRIIEGILTLALTRQGEIQIQPVPMQEVIEEVLDRLKHLVQEAEAKIFHPPTWPLALGYAPWIEEIWANYVSNAIKYGGRPPKLEFGFNLLDNQQARFWLKDNGHGLTPEQQATVFIPFTRLNQVKTDGHGLGLSIVQRIVERLGGRVGLESQIGQGSIFYFTLPLTKE